MEFEYKEFEKSQATSFCIFELKDKKAETIVEQVVLA